MGGGAELMPDRLKCAYLDLAVPSLFSFASSYLDKAHRLSRIK